MKESIKIQKNMSLLMSLIMLGIITMLMSIVFICATSYIVFGVIFAACSIVGEILSIWISVLNCKISKFEISKNGIKIKEKTGQKLLAWEDFTKCEAWHGGRGAYNIVLTFGETTYKIAHSIYALDQLIIYCPLPEVKKVLQDKRDKAC